MGRDLPIEGCTRHPPRTYVEAGLNVLDDCFMKLFGRISPISISGLSGVCFNPNKFQTVSEGDKRRFAGRGEKTDGVNG